MQGKEAPEKRGATKPAAENVVEHAATSVARKRTHGGTEHVQARDEDDQEATGRTGASGVDARVDDADARKRKGVVRRGSVGVSGVSAVGTRANANAPHGGGEEIPIRHAFLVLELQSITTFANSELKKVGA